MLIEHFYIITHRQVIAEGAWSFTLKLNPKHALYEGHFPGHPVVPGVCMLQFIKECVEEVREQSLQYAKIVSCKFLSVLNPVDAPVLVLELVLKQGEDGKLQLLAEGKAGNKPEEGIAFIKLKAQLIEQ
ncbi:MAG: hydroxymyristoyl-ACP dehydratase [Bacteroides sp.]|uniref:hydroxymyristoyl-ACP dehydratase n=1 Tax=Bacteroides sp. TaxID=29523 RepID=UPI002FC84464